MPMYRVTRKSVRKNASTPWFYETLDDAHTAEVVGRFKIDGGVSQERVVSEDGLTLTATYLFNSMETLVAFMSDPVVIENIVVPQQVYEFNNEIESSYVTEEVV